MINFVDTHAHLYDTKYEKELPSVIQDCLAKGVTKLYMPNLSLATIAPMLKIEKQYPTICSSMLGLHPCEVKKDFIAQLQTMEHWLAQHKFVVIGEVGIDLYWDEAYHKEQVAALHTAIDWALAYDLPLVLHVRKSFDVVLQVIKARKKASLRGIIHCFTGDVTAAEQFIKLDFFIGIGGIVTFLNSHLPHVVKAIALAHIVLETDSPYLSPMPYRGKRNTPGHLPLIAEKIATIKGKTLEEVACVTTANAKAIFEH